MPNLLRTFLLIVLLAEATTLPAQQAGAPVTIRAAQVIDGPAACSGMWSSLSVGRKSNVLRPRLA